MRQPLRLPDLLRATPYLRVPNAWDAASARRVHAAGAPFVATTSAGVAWSLGLSDGEALAPAQVLQRAAEIRRACPGAALSIDLERGYSDDPDAVAALVDALVDCGVGGINLEDGDGSPDVLAAKIRAIRARHGRDRLFVNARTDVYLAALAPAAERLAVSVHRARCYRDAGADGLFVPALVDAAEIAAAVQAVDLPLNLMAMPGLPASDTLRQLGVRRVSAGPGLAIAAYARSEEVARGFLADQPTLLPAGAPGFAEMDAPP